MMRSVIRVLPGVMASMMLFSGAPKAKAAVEPAWEESGQASWYGGRHNGRRTSSGTPFDQNAMTAAHATLPLGTRVRVTMQDTGESVVVTITDRQPPKGLRVIDLSRGAASRIGLLGSGVAMVTLTPAGRDEVEEVAEAPDDSDFGAVPTPRRHGPRHMRRGVQVASAARPYYRAPSVVPVRHSAPRQATRRRL
ncbi:MAG: septal ring lytic transglycosylase RlpA family protein [Acetobacteraceae bacterium]|nr:septal ring lytic transglycosylase RlpA family protein [Acetobacteraceae bacterium]